MVSIFPHGRNVRRLHIAERRRLVMGAAIKAARFKALLNIIINTDDDRRKKSDYAGRVAGPRKVD